MKFLFCCFASLMGLVVGASTTVLKNGAVFSMENLPAEAKAVLPKGGSISFCLEENATTGYEWTAAYSTNQVEVVIEHHGPVIRDGRCGAPGMASVRAKLKGKDAASGIIKMKYARSWEKNAPAQTMRIVLYNVTDATAR